MFQLRHVTYRGILNIDRLHIPAEQITCIIGESGSGKTTLLKLLNHLISADEGEIWFDRKLITGWNPIDLRRQVVMVSQAPAIFAGTVQDNLTIGLQFSEKPSVSDPQLMKVLQKVHLHKDLTEEADLLSGGEKQRLVLARVLLMNPKVLLLDEPSSALDEHTAQQVIGSIVDECRSNHKTIVMVTHSRSIVESFADNIVEIQQGRITRHPEQAKGKT